MKTKHILFIVCSICFSSCEGTLEDGWPAPDSIVTLQDLALSDTQIVTFDSATAEAFMNSGTSELFYNKMPTDEDVSEGEEADDGDTCVQDKLNEFQDAAEQRGDTLFVNHKVDLTKCAFPTPEDQEDLREAEISLTWLQWQKCAVREKGTLVKEKEVNCNKSESLMVQSMMRVNLVYEYESTESENFTGMMSSSLGPCDFSVSGEEFVSSDCRQYEVQLKDHKDLGSYVLDLPGQYLMVDRSHVVCRPDTDDIWCLSGTAQVTLQNWTGTVTYQGAGTSPTWELSDGTSTLSGTMTASTSLTKPQRHVRRLQRAVAKLRYIKI